MHAYRQSPSPHKLKNDMSPDSNKGSTTCTLQARHVKRCKRGACFGAPNLLNRAAVLLAASDSDMADKLGKQCAPNPIAIIPSKAWRLSRPILACLNIMKTQLVYAARRATHGVGNDRCGWAYEHIQTCTHNKNTVEYLLAFVNCTNQRKLLARAYRVRCIGRIDTLDENVSGAKTRPNLRPNVRRCIMAHTICYPPPKTHHVAASMGTEQHEIGMTVAAEVLTYNLQLRMRDF